MKKHLFFWASLLVAGLALTACGGDDADDFSDKTTPVKPTGKQKWTVTVGAGVMTRGLNDDLTPNWSVDDEVYVYYGNTLVGTLKPTAATNSGSVTLTGELDEADYSTTPGSNTLNLRYKYGATGNFNETPNYSGQKGTIEDIAEHFDYMNATVNITAVDNTAKTLTTGTANFQNLQSIMCLTFTEPLLEGDEIEIGGVDNNSVVTPGAIPTGTPIYVAVGFSSSPSTYGLYFSIWNSNGVEVYHVNDWPDKSLQNGKKYTATVNIDAVRLWKGGPLWATKNIGATSKTDLGSGFAWGETATKASSTWENYAHCNGTENTLTKYCDIASYGYNGYTDDLTELEEEDDVAYVTTDGNFRIPSLSEVIALRNNAAFSYGSTLRCSGKTKGFTGRSITLPNGEYWTRDLHADNSDGNGPAMAWAFYTNSFNYLEDEDNERTTYTNHIRAVYE